MNEGEGVRVGGWYMVKDHCSDMAGQQLFKMFKSTDLAS